jgi:transcriptional regulator with XRE-family HTH domain
MLKACRMTLYSDDFAKTFSELLDKSGVSCYQIGHYGDLDAAYLSRLKNGHKMNPSVETIVRICLALAHFSNKVDINDFERLFNAGGRSLFPKQKLILL